MNIVVNTFAVIIGLIVGGAVNMGLVILGPTVIPPPAGIDVADVDSIAAGIHLFQPQHFIFPFLAHALGTLSGAVVGHVIARSHRNKIAYGIGLLTLAGGIAAAAMIPAPLWFVIVDLVLAYIPMAFIATLLGRKIRRG